ncbi:MAG: CvpA family protein [Acidimicrobiia bacterium]|nr:CvpA family protein [Acidimicrobiia bacterium]
MFDFVFGLILASLLIRGWVRGLVRESLNLVSLFVGVWIAFRLSKPLGDYLTQSFGVTPEAARIGAGIGLFVLFGATMAIAAHYLSKLMGLPGLSTVNRVGGAAVASLWGVFLILVFVNIARVIPTPEGVESALEDSTVAEMIAGDDAFPQGVFEGMIGDRAITALAAIEGLFGAGRVVPREGEEFSIPPASPEDLREKDEEAALVLREINRHRTGLGLGALKESEVMSEIARSEALDDYLSGVLRDPDDCLLLLGGSGVLVAACDGVVALASTALGALDGLLGSPHGALVLQDRAFDRAGVAVVDGPMGEMVLVLSAG